MAKDRKKLLHIHSSIPDKQPTAASIEVGEIAVNNAANQEFLSIKNSNNKIKRFSSDEQIITWVEKKEVMPYEGYTRGSDGPSGATGPDSVTNNDLLQNKSNLIIKLNQVAATNTVKHDKVNGAKDIYGKCVNPTTDDGVTDGAGFAIDMSRYAMIGANPSFSSLTVTDKTDLSGNTTIANGNGTGTRTGHTLAIKTTDVTANDTNWTETITNRTSTVANETDKITTLNASATTANVSGNTLVLQEATSISAKTPTAYLSGTTLDVKETNTDITSCGRISANTNDFEVKQCAANGKFIVNSDDADVSGKTLDIIENTSVTVKTPAASVSGATLVADESTSISAKTPTAYLSGTTLDVKETNTDIQSCGRISANTNAFTVQECAAGSGKTVINQTDIKASGKTLSFDETTSISAKTPTTTLSGTNLNVTETTSTINSTNTNLTGTNLNISETNTTINSCGKVEITTDKYTLKQCSTSGGTAEFEFCNGYTVKSNAINLQQCGTAGTISIASQTQNINGGNLTVNESGNTAINTNGTTNIKSTGSTNIETNGANNKVTIQASGNGGDVEVFAKDTLCTSGGTTAAFVGATKTNIGMNCADAGNTAALNVRGVTTNISAGTITQTTSGNTTINVGGALTENVTGATTENHEGAVTINNTNGVTITTTGKTCMQSTTDVNIGGDANTNVGAACNGGVYSNNTSINASSTVNVNAPTTNITGNTNISGNTVIKGTTNISGATHINNNLTIPIPCDGITSTTVNNALCEVLDRGVVTIEKNTSPTDPQLATVYTVKQNGAVINTIEVAKDQFLQNAEVVKNTAGEWVIRLTWWIYDPDSGTHTTATTDVNASELVKDLTAVNPDDNGTAANHNVKVSSWYDSTSGDMKFSAETTPTMHITNLYATNEISAATVSGTTVKGATVSGTNITASAAIRANNVSANTLTAATSVTTKDLAATGNETVGGTLNVSGASTVNGVLTIPSGISKKLTWTSGTFTADTTGYNGSADKVITVPTSTAHLTKSTLTIDYNADVRGKSDTSYNTEAAATVSIPGSIDHLSNYDGTNINIGHPTNINGNVNVTGTVTASGAIYSSDRNLKENIDFVKREEFNKAKNIFAKSYNFKSDESKTKTYGVIAQEVQEAGLPELVKITDDKGTLGVDYTSLFVLKIAYLEDFCAMLNGRIVELENRIKELENKD